MAVHEKATGRLVGTCAFSQLDGENGSALYHITIGESDAWGMGFGTEATQLMLDHAFGTLGLHRIALYVFEFNERAIRAYTRCGFVIEGRSRESIWRDGRWWDELAMSVLESDWRATRGAAYAAAAAQADVPAPALDEPVGAGTSDRLRRTLGRWR
jgi:RimJ/RimL family protein N-acetyltransferase